MINLVRLLVAQGVITQDNGDKLIAQAESEAQQARTVAQQAAQPATLAEPAPGAVRVPYIPEIVKQQIRDQLKSEVLAQAKSEGWAQPDQIPDWINRITLYGDVRFRSQWEFFDQSNVGSDGLNGLIDFARINSNGPVDINPVTNLAGVPILNSLQERKNRFRIRARLGLKAHVFEGVTAAVRLATGDDNGPVSTNGLLGGGLSKKDVWIDQAYIDIAPVSWLGVTFGRMPNPFESTDLVWDEDLGFDGVAARLDSGDRVSDALSFGLTAGLFPLEYVSSNFRNNSIAKVRDRAKWLYAIQGRMNWALGEESYWKLAGAYYSFKNVAGRLSSPCVLYDGSNLQCDTDYTRPAFMQKGNTLFLLRNIVDDPARAQGLTPNPQFAGLLFDYDLLNLTSEIRLKVSDRYSVTLTGDYVRNLSYRASDICRNGAVGPVNNVQSGIHIENNVPVEVNFNPCNTLDPTAPAAQLRSGNEGWMVKLGFGVPAPRKQWDWNIAFGYRRLEPDAVIDAYADSDFNLGGTNSKGYFGVANLAVYDNVWLRSRWMSGSEVYGLPYSVDVLQLDLNVGF